MANKAVRYEIYKDEAGEFRARFRAGNGKIVWETSEGYDTKPGVNDAIDLFELAVLEKALEGSLEFAKERVPRIEVEL
jgi:uncharacterized protein YegP (UPF0339 family)